MNMWEVIERARAFLREPPSANDERMRRLFREVYSKQPVAAFSPKPLIPAHRGQRSGLTGPCRWYEQKVYNMHAIVDPRSPIWWRQLWYRLSSPVYDLLHMAGIIEIEPGALYSSARIVPLHRAPKWPYEGPTLRERIAFAFRRFTART